MMYCGSVHSASVICSILCLLSHSIIIIIIIIINIDIIDILYILLLIILIIIVDIIIIIITNTIMSMTESSPS